MVLNQQTEQAHQMLFVMKKFDYKPNDVTYSYLIEGYLTQENFQRAYSLLIEVIKITLICHYFMFYSFDNLINRLH